MSEQPDIEDFNDGDEVQFVYTTKIMGNRPTKSGEVVYAEGNVIKIEVDAGVGEPDVFVLTGKPGYLKDVYYRNDYKEDTFCGDRGRLMKPETTAKTPAAE